MKEKENDNIGKAKLEFERLLVNFRPTPPKKSPKPKKKRKTSLKLKSKLRRIAKKNFKSRPELVETVSRIMKDKYDKNPSIAPKEKPIFAYNFSTLETIKFINHLKCAKYFKISKQSLSYLKKTKSIQNNWIFTDKKEINPKEYKQFNEFFDSYKREIHTKNLNTGLIESFKSSRECYERFEYHKDSINRLARNNSIRKDTIFSYELRFIKGYPLNEGKIE